MILKGAAVIVLALLAAPAADNLTRPVPLARPAQVGAKAWTLGSTPSLPWPQGAQAAVGATGFGVLALTPGAKPQPTASVAKVMTALLTLEQRPLTIGDQGPAITITAQDVQAYRDELARNGSTVPVVVGEQLSEYQALEALMLPSANNIAITLSRWVGGSQAAFLQMMNSRAAALGMGQTTFTDPSGLDSGTVSVPADLVRAGQQAMTIPVFAQIVALKQAVLPIAGTVTNVNGALGQSGIVGIKTGNSDEAKAVYLAAATYQPAGGQPVLVYALVQGLATLSDCFGAAEKLVAAVEDALKVVTIVAPGQVLGRYTTAWGASSQIVAASGLSLLAWPGTSVTADLQALALHTPARRGSAAGTLAVTVGGHPVAVPATLGPPIAAPRLLWRLTWNNTISTLPAMTLLTWLSLTLAVAAALLALAALLRPELRGPNVGLKLVGQGAWEQSPEGEATGACVALLTNTGSRAGAAWDLRVAVSGPGGPIPAQAAVLLADRDAPAVIPVAPQSSVGVTVCLALPAHTAATGVQVTVLYGATRWPWGRATRRTTSLTIPPTNVAPPLTPPA